jgi:hypothetical protein
MKMQPNLSNLEIRIVNSEKEIPFHLLLAADPSEKLINRYLKNSKVFVGLLESIIIAVYVLSPLTKNRVEIKNISGLFVQKKIKLNPILLGFSSRKKVYFRQKYLNYDK